MKLSNETAATVSRVLNKFSDEVEPDGAWRWRCAVQNGTRLPIAASLEEGFLHLNCNPGAVGKSVRRIQSLLLGNSSLAGSVKVALNAVSGDLSLSADIVVLDEKQLHDRLQCALEGIHDGCELLKADALRGNPQTAQPVSAEACAELLREARWNITERGPGEFAAELDAPSAPPATLRISASGVVCSVGLVRAGAATEARTRAQTVFLLTATGTMRMVRAYAEEAENVWSFGVQAPLCATPAIEEIDHAMAALSIAYRSCARESNVLLDDAAARCYLSARVVSNRNYNQSEEEN